MRLMSVVYTEQAVAERRKFVTRRLGWVNVRVGERLQLCRKVMGRKRGEPLVRVAVVEVTHVRRESLSKLVEDPLYGSSEMILEGFRGLNPETFVDLYFVRAQRVARDAVVTRIAWRYVEERGATDG